MADKPLNSIKFPDLPDTYINNPASIAGQFDATASYTSGQYIYYNRKLHRFTSDHTGAWAAAHAEEVKVGERLSTAESDITDLKEDLDISITSETSWTKSIINAVNSGTSTGNGATNDIMYADLVDIKTGCRAVMRLFRNDTYLGKFNTLESGIDRASGNWRYFTGEVRIGELIKQYNATDFQLTLMPTDGTVIDAEAVAEYAAAHCDIIRYRFADNETTSEQIAQLEADTFIMSINHRGYSIEAPENTLPAFILSKKKGFQYAECDVEFTSDSVPVLLHDSTINRTARTSEGAELSETIRIGDITYEQALTYDFGIWKGEKWKGVKIPTLKELLLTCKKLTLTPVIELKDTRNGTYWTDERIAIVVAALRETAMQDRAIFLSFSKYALQKIGAYFPNALAILGLEGSYSTLFDSFVANLVELKEVFDRVGASVNRDAMTEEAYSKLTANGILPIVYVVNSFNSIHALNDSVYGVMSDIYNAGVVLMHETLSSLN